METVVAEVAISEFVRKCKEKQIRLTPQRVEMYRVLVEMDGHPSVDEVYQAITQKIPYVSKDTVYRTLSFFEEIGSISKVKGIHGVARYEVNTKPHHHFKCNICGKLYDFKWDEFEQIKFSPEMNRIGNISSCQVVIDGECQSCVTQK